jgi:two-component system phosphate regulon sensor histidine kinase PhoR
MGLSATLGPMTKFDKSARALLEALDDPALILQKHVVLIANEPARALLGDGIERRDVRLAIRHPQALAFALAGKTGDLELTGIGDIDRPWRLAVRPIGDDSVLVRLIDRAPAHAAEKLRVDFVANASHELRTPLTAVLGYAESLEDGDLDPELSSKFARTIRAEARRMLRIIEDLMSLSRIEADRFVAPAETIDLAAVTRQAIDQARPLAERSGVTVAFDGDGERRSVLGDRAQLVQAIENLVANAILYGGTGVTVAIDGGGESLALSVADRGPGIPAIHLPRLTQRFYRVDEARSKNSGGTGLGLAIVKHIVERHRAALSIDSAPGEGTKVTIAFPPETLSD